MWQAYLQDVTGFFMKYDNLSIHIWLKQNKIKNEKGLRIDFDSHLFLWHIYNDFSPKMVCLKAAQIGFSTMAILKSLWLAKHRGVDIIYTLPTANDVNDFVSGKVNRIIAQNPCLQEYVKDKDAIEQKKVGNNIIYYRGTWTEKAALMVSSDLNIYDEEDRSKQETIQQYSSRLQHSTKKWEWHFSNPSVSGNGVSRYWDNSTQSHWFIRCSRCDQQQYLKWPDSFDLERKKYVCRHCNETLADNDRRVGSWVEKYRDKEYKGYWIPLFLAPWVTAEEIIKLYETKSKEFFANFVLGLPYIGEGNTVSPHTIYANCTDRINSQDRVIIGCDSGLTKHYVLGTREGLFYYGKTDSWDTIEGFLKKYPRSVAVIDAHPDLTAPMKLKEKYPGRVFLCNFSRDRKTMQIVQWKKDKEYGMVLADRNTMIQLVVDEFSDMRIPLQGTQDDWSDYYSHWKSMYRVDKQDALGVPWGVWESDTGIDHWAFATVYWRIGMDKFGQGEGALLSGKGFTVPQASPIYPDGTIDMVPPSFTFDL